jgi:ribosomal protein S6
MADRRYETLVLIHPEQGEPGAKELTNREVERNLRLTDAVLRFVSVRQAENAPPTPDRTARRPEPEEPDLSLEGGDTDSLGEEI